MYLLLSKVATVGKSSLLFGPALGGGGGVVQLVGYVGTELAQGRQFFILAQGDFLLQVRIQQFVSFFLFFNRGIHGILIL